MKSSKQVQNDGNEKSSAQQVKPPAWAEAIVSERLRSNMNWSLSAPERLALAEQLEAWAYELRRSVPFDPISRFYIGLLVAPPCGFPEDHREDSKGVALVGDFQSC